MEYACEKGKIAFALPLLDRYRLVNMAYRATYRGGNAELIDYMDDWYGFDPCLTLLGACEGGQTEIVIKLLISGAKVEEEHLINAVKTDNIYMLGHMLLASNDVDYEMLRRTAVLNNCVEVEKWFVRNYS